MIYFSESYNTSIELDARNLPYNGKNLGPQSVILVVCFFPTTCQSDCCGTKRGVRNDHFFKEESLACVFGFDFLVDLRHDELIVHIFLKYFDDSRLQFRKILPQNEELGVKERKCGRHYSVVGSTSS